jgi:hypothetical protein
MVRNEHVVTLNEKPVPTDLPLDTDITIQGGPELAGDLRRELDAWRQDVGAEMMRPNPDDDPNVQLPTKMKRNKGGPLKHGLPLLTAAYHSGGAGQTNPLHESQAKVGRIAIGDGRFVDTGTGR